MNKWLILILILCSVVIPASADTHNASSCSSTDVQNAIDNSVTNDIINVPSGECTWTSGVDIPNDKKITLQGAGYNNTIISLDGGTLAMGESGSRITAIGFVLISGTSMIDVKGRDWRIDHCKFNNTGGLSATAVYANGLNSVIYPTGLVDNNIIINGAVAVNALFTFEKMSGIWVGNLSLGTSDAVYIENNAFTRTDNSYRNAVDANRGGKYVFRYNSVNGSYLEAHSLQNDQERATMKWEIYGNTINGDNPYLNLPLRIRGGTGIFFGNTVQGDYASRIMTFDNVRSYTSVGVAGLCDGNSTWDGNEDSSGYPCRDQIGRSTDAYLFNQSNPPYPSQLHLPAYLWYNLDLGFSGNENNTLLVQVINSGQNHIKANRDYYNYNSTFDGSSGVGTGTLASMPSTCTEGVGYWATNQSINNISQMIGVNPITPISGTLYKCTATDTWEDYYIPYTYPHPLTVEEESTNYFNSTWNTSEISVGSTNATSIHLPLVATGTYNFVVQWGDGNSDTITAYDQANATHTYASEGVYNLSISGTIIGFSFYNIGDTDKLIDVSHWGVLNLGNDGGYFYGCSNFNSSATDLLNLTGTTSLKYAFTGANLFNGGNIANWDISQVVSLYGTFDVSISGNATSLFNQDISGWNTSNVLTMYKTFGYATSFNQSIGNWDTSKVSTTYRMLYGATSFNQNISALNVTNISNMGGMLDGVTLSTVNYDALLNGWSAQPVKSAVSFHGGNSKYSLAGLSARNHLTDVHGWTITDGGLEGGFIQSLYNTGWQTVFINSTQNMTSIRNMMNSSNVQWIAKWNATSQKWETYKAGWSYRATTTTNGGDAVYLKSVNNDSVYRDFGSGNYNWTLSTGYNLIGMDYNSSKTLSQINASVNSLGTCDANQITYVNPETQLQYTYTCGSSTNGVVSVSAGEGMWINSTISVDRVRTW